QHMQLSSANSMNMGRLVPQIVYYIYAYAQLVKSKEISIGQPINFSVPTGNFGNILAAYYASQIGLPVTKLICTSNDNNVLT
ncbi:threonine synthase, partial [Nosocomiicoccus ampullae]|nr:threonine synthase [Nosocomiicoccus ampullae]